MQVDLTCDDICLLAASVQRERRRTLRFMEARPDCRDIGERGASECDALLKRLHIWFEQSVAQEDEDQIEIAQFKADEREAMRKAIVE